MSSSPHRRWDSPYFYSLKNSSDEFGILNFNLKYLLSSNFYPEKNSKVYCPRIKISSLLFLLFLLSYLGGTPPRPLKTWSQRSWPAILLLQMFNMSPLCLPPVINIQSSKSSFSAYFLFLLYKCINICKGICKYWWNGVHCNFINKTMVPISLFNIHLQSK